MSSRARQRKVRFRPEDIQQDERRNEIQKLRQQNAQKKETSRTGFNFTTMPLIIVGTLAIGTVLAVLNDPRVKNWLYGPRSLEGRYTWWQTSIVYQVYPRSFQDSDGDGVGDLKGITERLDYFKELSVEAIWLSPVYESPMVDFGYDVSDLTAIDPLFGEMSSFQQLINEAHARGIYVIMDFIPNHTSDQHWWFTESRRTSSASNPYRDYYIWHNGKKMKNGTLAPPNNWVSVFGGSMWEWDEGREQYYLHQFTKQQPDLNLRNPTVCKEIETAMAFWLEKGVDGFRVDAVRHMLETSDLARNEPRSHNPGTTRDQYEYWNHIHTKNLPETHDVIQSWRNLITQYEYKLDKDIFMVLEVFSEEGTHEQMPYYDSGAHMPFNFQLQKLNRSCDGRCVGRLVNDWLKNMPKGKWPNWVLGSHDVPRIADKMGEEFVDSLNMLLLLLPGTPTTYYGEELGMKGIEVSYEETQDPFGINFGRERYKEVSRDPCRSPMQWTYEQNAGFSRSKKTWLPVHPDYKASNVKVQSNDPRSHLEFYKRLAKLRRSVPFVKGDFDYCVVDGDMFSFLKFATAEPCYLVAVNFGRSNSEVNFRKYKGAFPPKGAFVPLKGFLVLNTLSDENLQFVENSYIELDKVSFAPGQGMVIRFWPPF